MEGTPNGGLRGLVQHWKSDLIAAVSVALIALPLSLGIALAAGAPAMAGIFSAVVGVWSPHSTAAVIFQSTVQPKESLGSFLGIVLMDDGTGQAFNYVLAAAVVSGALQTLLGIFKLGRIADIFHGSVIQATLSGHWDIIFAKQTTWALGTHSDGATL